MAILMVILGVVTVTMLVALANRRREPSEWYGQRYSRTTPSSDSGTGGYAGGDDCGGGDAGCGDGGGD